MTLLRGERGDLQLFSFRRKNTKRGKRKKESVKEKGEKTRKGGNLIERVKTNAKGPNI
jgi:hypothetical protein